MLKWDRFLWRMTTGVFATCSRDEESFEYLGIILELYHPRFPSGRCSLLRSCSIFDRSVLLISLRNRQTFQSPIGIQIGIERSHHCHSLNISLFQFFDSFYYNFKKFNASGIQILDTFIHVFQRWFFFLCVK